MSKLLKALLILSFIFFAAQASFAEEYKILVLPDTIQFDSTNYLIYPDSSTIFASDTINEIKKDGRIETVSMSEIRTVLKSQQRVTNITKHALKEFKYNYNIPFVDFKAIANTFSTNKILIITSQTDAQNFLLRRSFWDLINLPGEGVVDPAYKIATYAALIDVSKEEVLWQKTYYKTIRACEGRMIAQNFAPATEQLEKIKSYSTIMLSPEIARNIEAKILPPPIIDPKTGKILDVSNISKDAAKPTDEMLQDAINLKPKTMPKRPAATTGPNGNGVIINDL